MTVRHSRTRLLPPGGLLPQLLAVLLLLLAAPAAGGPPSVPYELQAKLLAKVAGYDGNMPARSNGVVRVGILSDQDQPVSARGALQVRRALQAVDEIAGLPHQELSMRWQDAASVAKFCREHQLSILYVTPGLSGHVDEMAKALAGMNLLSVGAETAYVKEGVVLGFDLVSGKPKLVVNLPQARRQQVKFSSRVLRLMRVID